MEIRRVAITNKSKFFSNLKAYFGELDGLGKEGRPFVIQNGNVKRKVTVL